MCSLRKSTAEFITKAKRVHGDRYDYSKVVYSTAKTKIIITCWEHGDFEQTPDTHINKHCGCRYCAKNVQITKEKFVERATIVHQNFYDYSDAHYKGMHCQLSIRCPEHGPFPQTPNSHLRGAGCPSCKGNKKKNTEEFISEAIKIHGNKYDYSKVEYVNSFVEVEIICSDHGSFFQVPHNHLLGAKCGGCAGNKQKNTKEFIAEAIKIHGNRYDYKDVNYIDINSKVIIRCHKHGPFEQSPNNHLRGQNCPLCKNKAETYIGELLSIYTTVQYQYIIENKRYDFYLPKYNILIERDGEQHYKKNAIFNQSDRDLEFQMKNDREKTELALKNGYGIFRLPYWLSLKHLKIEIENILNGTPTYPNIPDVQQVVLKPKPKIAQQIL